MKTILILLIAIAFCSALDLESPPPTPEEFLKGFLEGIGETVDVNKLRNCMKGTEGIINRVEASVQKLTKINKDSLIKGLKMLFAAVRDFLQMLSPCAKDFGKLLKLLRSIAKVNIPRIVFKILLKPGPFVGNVRSAIECFQKKNMRCAGQSVGKILKQIFFRRELQPSDAEEVNLDFMAFMKGFLMGLGERPDVEKVKACLKDGEKIMEGIRVALEKCKDIRKPITFLKGLRDLFNTMKLFMNNLMPCMHDFKQLQILAREIPKANPKDVMRKIMKNPSKFMSNVKAALNCFKSNNAECVGTALGSTLVMLFFRKLEADYTKFARGLLSGIGERNDTDNLKKCLKDDKFMLEQLKKAYNHAKLLKRPHLMIGLKMMVNVTGNYLNTLKPCMQNYPILQKLYQVLLKVNYNEIVARITKEPGAFVNYVRKALYCYNRTHVICFGRHTGQIMKLLFLNATKEQKLDFLAYSRGFLEGLEERNTNIDQLKSCLRNGSEVMYHYRSALEIMKVIKIQNLLDGLKAMLNTTNLYLKNLKPCMQNYRQLQLLLAAIAKANIRKTMEYIMKNPKDFLTNVLRALNCYRMNNSQCVGKATGTIQRILFLSAPKLDQYRHFFSGFLDGIHEVRTIDDLMRCMGDAIPIMNNIDEAINMISQLTIRSVIKGLYILFKSNIELNIVARPCLTPLGQVTRLANAVMNANLDRIRDKLSQIPLPFIVDLIEAVRAANDADYTRCGQSVGDIMYRIFLQDKEEVIFELVELRHEHDALWNAYNN